MDQKQQQVSVEAEHISQLACLKCRKLMDVAHLAPFVQIKCPDCGAEQIVPAKFGSFLLVKQLGAGGMGVIYRAIDRELGRHVAVKVMKKSLGDNLEFVNSFKREAQAAAALNHQNVVQIYSFGQCNGQPYIVMELMTGGKLDDLIAGGVPLDEIQALKIHLEVVEGLMAASDVGLVHGDVKPANVLFGKNGEAKVVDFGLARYLGEQQQGGPVWGTPYYIAPEKARGKPVDFRSDIYSLGATLFHVLTGKPPFDGPTSNDVVMARLNQLAPALSDFNPNIHPATVKMVARMLERDPAMRYPSYPALLVDMRAALAAAQKPQTKPMRISVSIPFKASEARLKKVMPRLNWKIAALALAGLLLLAAGAGGWVYHSRQQARLRQAETRRELFKQAQATGRTNFGRIIALAALINANRTNIAPYVKKADEMAAAGKQTNAPLAKLRDETDQAKAWLDETEDLLAVATTTFQRLDKAPDLETGQRLCAEIDSMFTRLVAIHTSLENYRDTAREVMKEISAQQDKVLSEQRRVAAEKTRVQELQRQAEAAQAEEKKQAAEREKMKPAIIQQELDALEAGRGANAPLIAKRKFAEAARSFSALAAQLTLAETHAAFANIMETYAQIVELQNWLQNALNRAPCKNCWLLGGDKKDVLKTDDKALTISLGNGGTMNIPWETVTLSQLLRMVDYYVKNSNLSGPQQAARLKQAALLCYESGAFKTAETYANAAGKADPDLRPDLNRLMPGIVAEE